MKIGIQTLKGQKHSLEVSESDTILAVKQRIASELGLGDAAEQKLIYLGKILTNEQTIAEVKIKPNEMLVVMTSKLKKPAAAPAPAAAAPAPAAAAATPAAAPAAAEPAAAAATPAPAAAPAAAAAATPAATPAAAPATPAAAPAPAAAVASSLQSSAASSIVMGSAYESSIVELMNLGFERQQVVDAMRAAYNNADRAAEYLFGEPSVLRAALAQAGPAGPAPSRPAVPSSPAAQQAPAANAEMSAPAAPVAGAVAAGGAAGGPSANDLMDMAGQAGIDPATIAQLRGVLQSNPALVPLLLQQVSQSSPELMAQLGNNPEALQQLLSGLAAGGGGAAPQQGGGGGNRGRAIRITEEENQQLVNLQALGFSRDVVVEAWLICDRNAEQAAQFLMEHGNEMMEDAANDEGDDHDGDADMGQDDEDDDEEGNIDGPYFE